MMRKILFTSIGRRVQLVRHFTERHWQVVGTDLDPKNCAAQVVAHRVYPVLPASHPQYTEALLEICIREQVDVLIPLYEPELKMLSQKREPFLKAGTNIVVSKEEVLEQCLDKYRLYQLLRTINLPTPETYANTSIPQDRNVKWVVKPRTGMGSKDIYIVPYEQVASVAGALPFSIIQRFIKGQEYSIDVYVAENGQVLSVVPRLRLEVRSGEVSKSITATDDQITNYTLQLLRHLRLYGPATIQGIKEEATGIFYFIEVNPRFGGGVPLTMHAGIPYSEFVAGKYEASKNTLHPYQSGLKMLRYDEAAFVTE